MKAARANVGPRRQNATTTMYICKFLRFIGCTHIAYDILLGLLILRVIDFRFGIFYIIFVFCATSEHVDGACTTSWTTVAGISIFCTKQEPVF